MASVLGKQTAKKAGGAKKASSGAPRKLKRGTFAEDAFEEIGDTVVIWSLRHYLATPKFSQEHLESLRRGQRGKASDSKLGEVATRALDLGARVSRRAPFACLADFVAHAAKSAKKS